MHDHGKVITQLSNGILQLDIPDVTKLLLSVFDPKINPDMLVNSPSILSEIDVKSFVPVNLYSNLAALRTSVIVTLLEGQIIIDGTIYEGQNTDIKLYLSPKPEVA